MIDILQILIVLVILFLLVMIFRPNGLLGQRGTAMVGINE